MSLEKSSCVYKQSTHKKKGKIYTMERGMWNLVSVVCCITLEYTIRSSVLGFANLLSKHHLNNF